MLYMLYVIYMNKYLFSFNWLNHWLVSKLSIFLTIQRVKKEKFVCISKNVIVWILWVKFVNKFPESHFSSLISQ